MSYNIHQLTVTPIPGLSFDLHFENEALARKFETFLRDNMNKVGNESTKFEHCPSTVYNHSDWDFMCKEVLAGMNHVANIRAMEGVEIPAGDKLQQALDQFLEENELQDVFIFCKAVKTLPVSHSHGFKHALVRSSRKDLGFDKIVQGIYESIEVSIIKQAKHVIK